MDAVYTVHHVTHLYKINIFLVDNISAALQERLISFPTASACLVLTLISSLGICSEYYM